MSPITKTPILLGESGASVFRVTQENAASWIEKSGPPAEIALEAEVLRWCEARLPVARIFHEQPGVLCISDLPGRPLSDLPLQVACSVLADALSRIHAIPIANCPFGAEWNHRQQEAEMRIAAGVVDALDFDEEKQGRSPESILAELRSLPPLPEPRRFTHGDATLENFLAQDRKLSGIVDMARAGLTHPAQDWALALRSVKHQFGREGEQQLRRYLPRDCTDASLLRRFCLLDELF